MYFTFLISYTCRFAARGFSDHSKCASLLIALIDQWRDKEEEGIIYHCNVFISKSQALSPGLEIYLMYIKVILVVRL